MMRLVLLLVPFVVACATKTPAEVLAYCDRWANKYVAHGTHEDPAAYHADLVSTCMALKKVPYQPEATRSN